MGASVFGVGVGLRRMREKVLRQRTNHVSCGVPPLNRGPGGVIPGAGGGGMFGEGAQLAGGVLSRLGTPVSYEHSEEPQLFGVLGSEGSKRICCFASCTTSVAVKHRVVDASRASPPVISLEGQAPLVVSSGTPLHDMTDVEGVIVGVPELVVVSTETLTDM